MRSVTIAAAAASSVFFHSAATAQMSVDEAHATVNRLLDGAGDVVILRGGRTLDAYFTLRDVRSSGQCTTAYKATVPSHPDIPASAHGTIGEGDVQWSKISGTRVDGRSFFRRDEAGGFSAHFRFNSAADASRFAQAAAIIMESCGSGEQAPKDEQPSEEVVHDEGGNSGSLAIDRRNGSRYGWAIDYGNWADSDARALSECQRTGGRCQIVLRFTGGCGAYAADQARGSSVYGWGTARTRQAAESRAWSEARERGATSLVTRVWGCNSERTAASAGQSSAGSAAASPSGASAAGAPALPGRGKLSEEVIRRNEEAARAHREQVEAYERKIRENQQQLANAVAERKASDEAHQRELARARAAQEQFERERQAYREEYKRVTGRYPDE